ncbi:hypothetical protein BJ973_007985 [Actinoplanes tereljensis]|uniref:YwqJ-like deaminase n=1 Tax=Paractinoplanes tereljensis TaxID=571912 RepID=A0A919NV30_9ACTN|nr:SUKH-3 domain-containing protein [Actinoplanes tereljensis]GIF24506.1 hypothetical protein Ate02nite_72360 [Actinoplanes tereljensis]
MITRADADASAAAWARAASLATGAEQQAAVEEFDLGFIVTVAPVRKTFAAAEIGTGSSVIDRATGRVSSWPNWPAEMLEETYREQRDAVVDPPKTSDPEVQLRREAQRKVAPGVAAHATVEGRVYLARGAKGDQKLNHHRLVLERLAEQTPQQLVRGCERHAEMIVCSDVLHEADRKRGLAGSPPLTLDEARQLLLPAQFETFQIREPDDPAGGTPNDPCESCVYVLTQLALMPWEMVAALVDDPAAPAPNPDPERFSDTLAAELIRGSYLPGTPADLRADLAAFEVDRVLPVAGREHRHQAFPAMLEALAQTGSLVIHRHAAGLEQRSRVVYLGPEWAKYSADVLHEFGQIIGSRLFPIGSINNESILAVDERGRIFDLDQAGEWFIAETFLEALETLVVGWRTYRVRDDGTWGPGDE